MEEKRPKKLLDQVRDATRLKHYSIRTEQAYVGWIKRYILFHDVRHPAEMGATEVEALLTHLAVKEDVAALSVPVEPWARLIRVPDIGVGGQEDEGMEAL